MVHAKRNSSDAVAFVFVCSITGAVTPNYKVDWWKMDPEHEVHTLLYIGRRDRVTERAIGQTH